MSTAMASIIKSFSSCKKNEHVPILVILPHKESALWNSPTKRDETALLINDDYLGVNDAGIFFVDQFPDVDESCFDVFWSANFQI